MDGVITQIDSIEARLVELMENGAAPADIRSTHDFTPGLYIRGCRIPAGTLLVSEIHKTEHPFVITEGVVRVWTEDEGTKVLKAPYHGITKPGTRRVLYTETETFWTTYHPTNETDVEKIGAQILDRRENPLLGDHPLLHQWLTQLPKPENKLP
jgi:hypothetical protein